MSRREDMEWLECLEEIARIAGLNDTESSRYRVLGEGTLNWVTFDFENDSALFVQYHTDNMKHIETGIDCGSAFDLMKKCHEQVYLNMRNGIFDPMYISPADWIFVRDIEFEEVMGV